MEGTRAEMICVLLGMAPPSPGLPIPASWSRKWKVWALVLVLLVTSSVALGLQCLGTNTGVSHICLLGL